MRHLLDVADLGCDGIHHIIRAANDAETASVPRLDAPVGLLFLDSSLRTRIGFAVATARLGGLPLDISQSRWSEGMSNAEPFSDTLRVITGMVKTLVVRTPFALDRGMVRGTAQCPVVNGGDAAGEHPTQALIDLFAMQSFAGPIPELHVGISGDLTMRATRSLLAAFAHVTPRRLRLIAPPSRRGHGLTLPTHVEAILETSDEADFEGLDVLHLAGLPMGQGSEAMDDAARAAYSLNSRTIRTLGPRAIVLSPMPIIDEISQDVRSDKRIRMFDQSDGAVSVRVAVLSWVLGVQAP